MKNYYKNGTLVQKPQMIKQRGYYVYNPTDSILIEAGYEIKEESVYLTNDDIRKQRQQAYQQTSDQYLIAYQAYTELGEHEKAAQMKNLWIAERQRIDEQYPYTE